MRKEKKEAIYDKASSTNVRLQEIDEEIEVIEDDIESRKPHNVCAAQITLEV